METKGGVANLVQLLLSREDSVRRNVTGAIANLSLQPALYVSTSYTSRDSHKFNLQRWDVILSKDAIAPLVICVQEGAETGRHALCTLANMATSPNCWQALCDHQLPALFVRSLGRSLESEESFVRNPPCLCKKY